MAEIDTKALVSPVSSDKVLYYYKIPNLEPLSNPCHPLGTQGASSGTNTATLGTTATKQANVKDTGSINQQRVVNVVMTKGGNVKTDVARDLYYVWENHLQIVIYRVDWNTLREEDGKQTVNAEMSICMISALPETEALNTPVAQNVTFEVQGVARRYDHDGNPFVLHQEDFDEGMFDAVVKFYNFAKPSEIGKDTNGEVVNNAADDSHAGDKNGTVELGAKTDAASENTGNPSSIPGGSGSHA